MVDKEKVIGGKPKDGKTTKKEVGAPLGGAEESEVMEVDEPEVQDNSGTVDDNLTEGEQPATLTEEVIDEEDKVVEEMAMSTEATEEIDPNGENEEKLFNEDVASLSKKFESYPEALRMRL